MDDIIWSYREGNDWMRESDLVGFDVEATDGRIGTVDEASTEASGSWLVVDAGSWLTGKRRLVPAGTISGVDLDGRLVMVNMTKEQIKAAPDYDKDTWDDDTRVEHADYYVPYSGTGGA